jgi:hypothetical protein
MLGLAAAWLVCGAGAAVAASSTSSAVSEGLSASVGSVSTSFEKSSNASSGGEKKAEGPYRVLEVAAAGEQRPGVLRLALQAVGGEHAFALVLPQAAVDAQRIATGAVIHATPQPYGVAFAMAAERAPFYLVLDDDWADGLQTRPVKG